MSLEMFVFAIPNGNDNRFPRSIVERAFADYVEDVKDVEYCLRLKSGEETPASMSVDDEELIDHFSIDRPPSYEGFPEFWNAIYEILRQTRTFCFVAGIGSHPNFCVANPDALDEVPAELVENRGGARLVSSGAELEMAVVD